MKRTTRLAAALALALGATALYAHPFGPGPGFGMGGSDPGYGMGGYGRGAGCGFGPGAAVGPGAFAEHRLSALKSELSITPAQETAWNAYAAEVKAQADAMRKWMTTMRASATLPERIELRDRHWKERQAQGETMAQKIKGLYAVLTPEQKAIADRSLGGFGPRAGGGPGWRFR